MRPPGVLLPEKAPEMPVETANPRTRLAGWAVDPENPLTAGVMVNRIWESHFGPASWALPTISAAWASAQRTPNCWITWPTNSSLAS